MSFRFVNISMNKGLTDAKTRNTNASERNQHFVTRVRITRGDINGKTFGMRRRTITAAAKLPRFRAKTGRNRESKSSKMLCTPNELNELRVQIFNLTGRNTRGQINPHGVKGDRLFSHEAG